MTGDIMNQTSEVLTGSHIAYSIVDQLWTAFDQELIPPGDWRNSCQPPSSVPDIDLNTSTLRLIKDDVNNSIRNRYFSEMPSSSVILLFHPIAFFTGMRIRQRFYTPDYRSLPRNWAILPTLHSIDSFQPTNPLLFPAFHHVSHRSDGESWTSSTRPSTIAPKGSSNLQRRRR